MRNGAGLTDITDDGHRPHTNVVQSWYPASRQAQGTTKTAMCPLFGHMDYGHMRAARGAAWGKGHPAMAGDVELRRR